MRRFACTALIATMATASACTPDSLAPVRAYVPRGGVVGHICDQETGTWIVNTTVWLDTGEDVPSALTDGVGRFEFIDVPAGEHTIYFDTEIYPDPITVEVPAGDIARFGPTECLDPRGALRGRVCDLERGRSVGDALVTLNDAVASAVRSDADGYFLLTDIAPGDYQLSIAAPGFGEVRDVTVTTGQVGDTGSWPCNGGVEGYLCIGGYYLAGARVSTQLNDGTVFETITGEGGHYLLEGLPPGTHTLHAVKSSFEIDFDVEVTVGEITQVPAQCFSPGTQIAVITGHFDSSEELLADIGLPIREQYWSVGSSTVIDSTGNVDMIHGRPVNALNSSWASDINSQFWIRDFLNTPTWMAQYDIIFIDCGVNVDPLWQSPRPAYVDTAIANVRDWVDAGGSLYGSDWAAELIRDAFPGEIDFLVDALPGHGYPENEVPARITDAGLSEALHGSSTVQV
ncbi:MAG: carboxypeptidase-like regulatory domain-containing protein, partial [Myxococcota bacterium]